MRSCCYVIVATLALAGALQGEITFQFNFTGSVEFNDPVNGQERKDSLASAAARIGAYFENDATIVVEVTSSNDPASDLLASAAANAVAGPGPIGFTGLVPERKIIFGVDDNGSEVDGFLDVNFGIPWDLDDDIDPAEFDFKSTIVHELAHLLGFASFVFEDGTDFFFTPPGEPGVWPVFDQFLSDAAGTPIINPTTFALDGSAWATHSIGGASPGGGLFFNGPHAMAANGGNPVGLYSPNPWFEGSSGSHLDDDNPALAGLIMLSTVATGPTSRNLSPIEIAMFQDLGYSMRGVRLGIDSNGSDVTLTVDAPPGTYQLVQSTNLSFWTPAGSVTVEPPATTASLPLAAPAVNTYYRVGEASTASPPPSAPPAPPGGRSGRR